MEILTFATGLVVGTILVQADLANVPHAELRLDGDPVCILTPEASSCPVDLGPTLTGHRLDLVAAAGRRGGRPEVATRLLNLPGSDAPEVRIHVEVQPDGARSISIGWAHPERLLPTSIAFTLDGVPVPAPLGAEVPVCLGPASGRHVVAVSARFPDGSEAAATRLLASSRASEARDELTAVPLEIGKRREPTADGVSARLGKRVRQIEAGDTTLILVLDPEAPAALAQSRGLRAWAAARSGSVEAFRAFALEELRLRSALEGFDVLRFVHPESPGPRFPRVEPADVTARHAVLTRGVAERAGPSRLADAVAASGLLAAAARGRRAVVLLAGDPRPDASRFGVAEVRAFLRELMVPLLVLRTGPPLDPEWGAADRVFSEGELATGLGVARRILERQRIAWVEGSWLPSALALEPRGDELRLAGRGSSSD